MITVADGTGLVGHCCNHLLRRRRRNGILVLAFGLGLTNLGVATMGASAQTSANNLSSPVCTENLIRVDAVMESPKLAE
jgi:hypothetical protein